MKKKLICLMLSVMMLSMAACGSDSNTDGGQESSSQESSSESQTQESSSESQEESQTPESDDQQEEASALIYLRDAVAEVLGDNYWPNMQIPQEMLEGIYGVTADMYDDFYGDTFMTSMNIDTLLIVQAKEDQVEAVEEALNAYRDKKVSETVGYPKDLGKVQACRVEVIGNYVCFVMLGADTMTAMDAGDEAVIQHCLEENEKAIDAIQKAIEGNDIQ